MRPTFRHALTSLAGATALLLAACTTPPAAPTSPTAPPPPAPSSSRPAEHPVSLAQGRSPELATGLHRAFWIWRDDDGVWHLRTTASRLSHRFQGVIRSAPGTEIVELRPISVGKNDRLAQNGPTITFDWHTKNRIDGFDFTLRGEGSLEFDLRLDGDDTSRYIYLGKNKSRPERAHFRLSP